MITLKEASNLGRSALLPLRRSDSSRYGRVALSILYEFNGEGSICPEDSAVALCRR
jgi:hypothetical protein